MNKFATIAFFGLVLTSVLYGCQAAPESSSIDEQPLDRRIGMIKSLGGVKTSSAGTHLLQLDDGTTILLKSLQINLDNPEYAGKEVEIRGLVTYTTDGKQIMDAMNIDVLQEETSQAVDDVSWKDYASSSLGFVIKYRSDFKLDDSESGKIKFEREILPEELAKQGTQETSATESTESSETVIHAFAISRLEMEEGGIETYLGLTDGSGAELLAKGLSKSKIGANSMDGYKKSEETKVTYYVPYKHFVYTLLLDSGKDTMSLSDQNLFYEMLSTFRVVGDDTDLSSDADLLNNLEDKDSTDSTEETEDSVKDDRDFGDDGTEETESATQEELVGFTLLESEVFNFSLQYPKSWYYEGSAGTESGVVRHYDFGTKPLDEVPGTIALDITTTSAPSGTSVTVNGKTLTKTYSGSTVTIYVKGSGSRVYKFSGPTASEETLIQMAGSVEG